MNCPKYGSPDHICVGGQIPHRTLRDELARQVDSSDYVVPDGYVLMPIIPTIEMMLVLRERSIWPDDWSAGKLMQQEMGTDVVPPVTEMECACGQYQRLLKLGKAT